LRLENVAALPERPRDLRAVAALRERLRLGQRQTIVYTGNLEHHQGLDLLREGVRQLQPLHPDIVVVIVGGEPAQVEAERERVRRLGLAAHFVFAGQVALEAVPDYLDLADILVSPRRAGLSVPLKLYAYLQSGKPILATRIEAHTQLLTDELALLVDPTPDGVAAGLERLAADPGLRQVLGERARTFGAEVCAPGRFLFRLNQAYASIRQGRPIAELALEASGSAQSWA
jgi:glycosyltransferase involved in cell wall biosynthesis